jgi:hypothetical protein
MPMNRLQELIEEIRKLEKELYVEVQKKQDEFFYRIKGHKVYFEEATREYHRTLVTRIRTYLRESSLPNLLSVPLIWACLPPALLLDLFVSIFHGVCFRLYGIPLVIREEYVVIDRQALTYLNLIEKINCVYCGYFNGLVSYVMEIAARTEQYWCPIKHARKKASLHSRYRKFLEYGDAESYRKRAENVRRDFRDLEEKTE